MSKRFLTISLVTIFVLLTSACAPQATAMMGQTLILHLWESRQWMKIQLNILLPLLPFTT